MEYVSGSLMPATPLIEVRNVSGGHVNDLSFAAYASRVTAIVGLERPMKTSLLRLLLGLEQPDSGELLINGRACGDYGYDDLRTVVGVLSNRLPRRVVWSVQGYLRWRAFWLGVPLDQVDGVIAMTGLEHERASRIPGLTAGGRLRFGLAVALLSNPQALILDDPLAGLDGDLDAWMRDFLKRQAKRGVAVLITSPPDLLIDQTADDAVLIDRGRILCEGSISQLKETVGAGPRDIRPSAS